MSRADSLVTAVTRAVQRADSAGEVRSAACDAAVDAGFEFACFCGRNGAYVTASEPDVDSPPAADVVPTFRSVSATALSDRSDGDGPAGPDGPAMDDETGDDRSEASETSDSETIQNGYAESTDDGDGASSDDASDDCSTEGGDASDDCSTDGGTPDAVRPPAHTQVACIDRSDGYTIAVPVVDCDEHFGTFALGATDRVDDDAEREVLEAAGAVVGQALSRVAAVAERDEVRETLRRERRQFEKLHSVAAGMVGCEDAENIYHLAIDAAENILEFDICGIDVVEDGYFVPVATSTGMEPEDSKRIPKNEGIAGATFDENRTIIVDDVREHPLADPANPEYRSVLSVPIEGVGIFQAGSTEANAFSGSDAELVELLMAHVSATLQRLRSDVALRESEQKYRTLIEQSHDAVVIYRDGSFEFVNQRAAGLFGRDRDELVDDDTCELLHPEDRPKLERIVGELAGGAGRQQTFEGRIRRPNGDVRFCEFSATSIQYEGDLAVLGSIRDITERKARERDLERQNERLEEFASVVSHDLRSPINVARGSVDLARDTGDLSHLDRATDALDRMEALVDDILQLARQGQLVDETDPVAVDEVAADAWRSVDAPDASLTVETDATIDADRTRLRELFENLFRNSVEHGGSAVAVRVASLDDGFVVEDDGQGLPADSHDEVFDRGFTSTEDGTGFGLAIVESIADAHGWTVDAVPPGDAAEDATTGGSTRGARFEITGCSPD